jgi:threonine dehydratase
VKYAIWVAFHYYRLVLEPGGAAALAAALFGKCEIKGKTTVVIASGGNVDEIFFQEILNKYSYLD